MTSRPASAAAIGLLLLLPGGCTCGTDHVPVVQEAARDDARVDPPPLPSALPEARPKRFAIAYARSNERGASEHLQLGNLGARQSSTRGQRSVSVTYSPNGPVVDEVYGSLRTHACDQIATEPQTVGSIAMELTAGAIEKTIDHAPTRAWASAFEGCTSAMARVFPSPVADYVELELRFPDEDPPDAMAIELDLGPDHRGIDWRDDGATAIVFVAKRRRVDVDVSARGGSTSVPIELAAHAGVAIAMNPDAAGDELAIGVTAIEQPAKVVGTVRDGPNRRIAAAGRPRPDLAGEPSTSAAADSAR